MAGAQDTSLALMLYTERHFKRMDRLLQSTFVLDYLLQGMHVYDAVDMAAAASAAPAGGHGPAQPSQRYLTGISAMAGSTQQGTDGDASGGAAQDDMVSSSSQEVDPDELLRPVPRRDGIEGGSEDAADVSTSASDAPDDGSMPGWGGVEDSRRAADGKGGAIEQLEERRAAAHRGSRANGGNRASEPRQKEKDGGPVDSGAACSSSDGENQEHLGTGVLSPAAANAQAEVAPARAKRRRSAGDAQRDAGGAGTVGSKQGKRRRASADEGRRKGNGASQGTHVVRVKKKGRRSEM